MAEPTELLTVKQAAGRLNVSERTLERLLSERRIRKVKIGRLTRITSREVENYIASPR
jgi:excisionase family DNA binding protein